MAYTTISIDDRIRLLAAVLAVTTWPTQEQETQPHGIHPHAKATQARVKDLSTHPAATMLQDLLDGEHTLHDIFSAAYTFTWPEIKPRGLPTWASRGWLASLKDFRAKADLTAWWADGASVVWSTAQNAAETAFQKGDPHALFSAFFGSQADKTFVFHPNLAFPTLKTLRFEHDDHLIAVVPPLLAWGTNPPWPYDQDPAATQREAFRAYTRLLLTDLMAQHHDHIEAARQDVIPLPEAFEQQYTQWHDQFAVLVTIGLTALYLRNTFGESEERAFLLMERKEYGFDALETIVKLLEHFMSLHSKGRHETFGTYIPTFQRGLLKAQQMGKL